MFSIVLLCCVVSLFMISNILFVAGLLVDVGGNQVVAIEFIVALYYLLYLFTFNYPHLLLSYTFLPPNSTFPFQFAT